jgi:hypothetical protein
MSAARSNVAFMNTSQPSHESKSYRFLAVRSAEGRRSTGNREISGEQYEKARQAIMTKLPKSGGQTKPSY